VRRKAGWGRVSNATSDYETSLVAGTLCSFEHGPARVAVFVNANSAVVGLDRTRVGSSRSGRIGDVRVRRTCANGTDLDSVGAELWDK
jgi:hypothetical protein